MRSLPSNLLCRKPVNLLLILLISIAVGACTNLSGEPEIVRTLPPPLPPTEAAQISTIPDLGDGATIFATNCTSCHGANGAGDGELVASGQVMNPGNFTAPEQMAEQTPQDYFDIITNGNLANLMPPWANALTAAERWSVAMFTYTLHYSSDQLESGEAIVAENDLEPLLTNTFGDLSDPQTLISVSEQALIDSISATGLDEDASGNAAAYVRTLSLETTRAITAPLAQIQPTSTPAEDNSETEDEGPTGTLTGVISNGTAGATVPQNMTVSLRIFRSNTMPPEILTEADANGNFQFDDVPILENVFYVVATDYQDIEFVGTAQAFTGDLLNIPIQIFEITSDPGVIQIDVVQTQLRNLPNSRTLEVIQEYQFSNVSDRMFRGDRVLPDGRNANMTFSLPPAAVILAEEETFFFDAERFEYIDTRHVPPGQGYTSLFAYFLPFAEAAIIEHDILYLTNAETGIALINLNPSELTLISNVFAEIPDDVGVTEPISPEENTVTYAATLANLGNLMQFELRADPVSIGTSADNTVVTSDNFIPIAGAGLVIVLAFVGGFVMLARRQDTANAHQNRIIDDLVDQLARLEAAHDSGEINHDIYQRQKAELQAKMDQLNRSASENNAT